MSTSAVLVLAKEVIRKDGRRRLVEKWQTRWHGDQSGTWTHRLIPELATWLDRKHGQVGFYLAQALSGDGCFNAYPKRLKKRDDELLTLFSFLPWLARLVGLPNGRVSADGRMYIVVEKDFGEHTSFVTFHLTYYLMSLCNPNYICNIPTFPLVARRFSQPGFGRMWGSRECNNFGDGLLISKYIKFIHEETYNY